MAAKGEVGLDLDVAKVPLREAGMEPFEIMISESQERMLCVVEPALVDEVIAVCEKWEVNATAIGVVTDTRRLRVLVGDEVAGDLPVTALVDECPAYDLAPAAAERPALPGAARACSRTAPAPEEALRALLGSANLASRRPVFEQYDAIVGSRTARRPEQADAAVLMLTDEGAPRPALAVAIDGNGRRVARAIRTAARSRPCSSARPTSPASAPSRSG